MTGGPQKRTIQTPNLSPAVYVSEFLSNYEGEFGEVFFGTLPETNIIST